MLRYPSQYKGITWGEETRSLKSDSTEVVGTCKLDTDGIYINDLWKHKNFRKTIFFLLKNPGLKNIFRKKNPEIHKIEKTQIHIF